MTVVSLDGRRPSARYDRLPWVEATISEGSDSTGPFTLIDTIALDPLDTDPTNPQVRDFTTTRATLTSGWYEVTFKDAAGNPDQATLVAWPPATQPVAPGSIATLAELKRTLDKTKDVDDDELERILAGVSDRIEHYCGRLFHPDPPLDDTGADTLTPVEKTVYLPRRLTRRSHSWGRHYYIPPRHGVETIQIPDAREITDVTAQGATITGWQPIGDPPWRRVEVFNLFVTPGPETIPALVITGRFGLWPAPEDLKDAVLTMAARRWKERDANFGDTVQFPEGMTVSFFRQFPPSVQATVDLYARKVGMV